MEEVKTPEKEKEVKPNEESKPLENHRETIEITEDTSLKIKKKICLKELRKKIDEFGPWSINKTEFAEKYFINWHTIDRWFNGIIRSLSQDSNENISRKGEKMIDNHLKRLEEIAETSGDKEKIAAITASFKGLDTLGNWLERFGRKQKIAEKLEVSGNIAVGSAEHLQKIWEETNAESKSDHDSGH